jgi:2,3-diketo-5-methylthio-1-phosphopentane phosphatase
MTFVILCDFDGTIVDIDTAEYLLEKFGQGNWQQYDMQLEQGEITLEECMIKQYAMIKTPKAVLLEDLANAATMRPHFDSLVAYCKARKIPLIIVSAGLDFCITYFLEKIGDSLIEIHAAKTNFSDKGIELVFPELRDKTSTDFKVDLIRFYQNQAKQVVYIGDSLSDFNAVKDADFSFTIKGAKLSEFCRRQRIRHQEIETFQEIIDLIQKEGSSLFSSKTRLT